MKYISVHTLFQIFNRKINDRKRFDCVLLTPYVPHVLWATYVPHVLWTPYVPHDIDVTQYFRTPYVLSTQYVSWIPYVPYDDYYNNHQAFSH